MPPIVHSGRAPSAALRPGRAMEQGALARPLGNTSDSLQGRHQPHHLSTRPSSRADKLLRSADEASPPHLASVPRSFGVHHRAPCLSCAGSAPLAP